MQYGIESVGNDFVGSISSCFDIVQASCHVVLFLGSDVRGSNFALGCQVYMHLLVPSHGARRLETGMGRTDY